MQQHVLRKSGSRIVNGGQLILRLPRHAANDFRRIRQMRVQKMHVRNQRDHQKRHKRRRKINQKPRPIALHAAHRCMKPSHSDHLLYSDGVRPVYCLNLRVK